MLQKIREKSSGWVAGIIVGLLVLTFALFGINSYFGQGQEPVVATVNDTEIKSGQFQRAFYNIRQQMQNLTGESVPVDDPAFRNEALQRIIDIELMNQTTRKYNLAVSDLRVYETINSLETFRNEDGFDQFLYQRTLTSMGMTEPAFEQQIANDMKSEQFQSAIAESAFTIPGEVERIARLRQQTRDFNYTLIPVSDYVDDIEVSEADITAYYEEHKSRFIQPEQVKIRYIDLTMDKVAGKLDISADEIESYFQTNRINYMQPERRQVWQAKIKVQNEETFEGDVDAAAREKAAEIARIFSESTDFVKVAEEHSSPPDADIIVTISESGEMKKGTLKEELDSALFELSAGDVSEPIKSGDSWHVMKVINIMEAEEKSFAEVSDQVEKDLRRQRAGKRFFEMAEQLAALAYEHPDTLEFAADATELAIEETGFFSSEGTDSGIAAEPKVINASFSEDVLLNGNNSEALELDPERLVVLRVAERKPQSIKSLQEVRESIVTQLKRQQAKEKVRQISANILEETGNGMSLAEAAAEFSVETKQAESARRDDISVNRSVLRTAFRLQRPDEGKTRIDSVTMGDGDVAIVELTGVAYAEDIKGKTIDSITAELQQLRSATDWNGLFQQIREDSSIKIIESNL